LTATGEICPLVYETNWKANYNCKKVIKIFQSLFTKPAEGAPLMPLISV